MGNAINILQPATTDQLDDVRSLMRAFVQWHRQRHVDDLALIDQYFDARAFDEELQSLPGKYSPPEGGLLLATYDGQPAGCVALRRIDDRSCEMKRMFVYEAFHGKGVGKALGQAVIREGRSLGYGVMKLDTSFRQEEAQSLYARLGFEIVAPYYNLPKELENWLVFMEMKL